MAFKHLMRRFFICLFLNSFPLKHKMPEKFNFAFLLADPLF